MLRLGEVYFASPSELNDPDEGAIDWVLSGDLGKWIKLAQFILTNGLSIRSRGDADRSHSEYAEDLGRYFKKTVGRRNLQFAELESLFGRGVAMVDEMRGNRLPEDVVISCKGFIKGRLLKSIHRIKYTASFCMDATKPLMWAYYANAEKGFAVIFESDDETLSVESDAFVFRGSEPLEDGSGTRFGSFMEAAIPLNKVTYRSGRVKINALDELSHHFEYSEDEIVQWLFEHPGLGERHLHGLVKSREWKHEAEVRALFPNDSSWNPVPDLIEKDLRCVRVSRKHLKGVILGSQMSHEDRERACVAAGILARRFQQASADGKEFVFLVFEAKKTSSRLKLQISPYGIINHHRAKFNNGLIRACNFDVEEGRMMASVAAEINGNAQEERTA